MTGLKSPRNWSGRYVRLRTVPAGERKPFDKAGLEGVTDSMALAILGEGDAQSGFWDRKDDVLRSI